MVKKIFNSALILSLLLFFPIIAKANSIDKIDMDIYLDKEGTAHVTEVWSANLSEGTEGYKPYYNLGNAKITNFKVSDNNKTYTFNSKWNTSSSFSDKAYKNGINYISDGVELCWGISSYGYHNYKLTYDIEGFVSTLTDADMIYWTLIPYELSSKPKDVHIKIYSDSYFDKELPVWGYGNYGGTSYVYDGYIEMNSEGTLESNEYMTILVKFDKGTFNTYNTLDNNFEYYHNMADKGATKYKKSILSKFVSFIAPFLNIAFQVIFWGVMIFIFSKISKNANNKVGTKTLDFDKEGKTLPKDIPNIRDIPFNKDIYRAFWIAESYKLNSNKTDFLGAILLKWLMEKKISINKVQTGLFSNKEESTIVLNSSNFVSDNKFEIELHQMMVKASCDGILESKEFEKWCNKNYSNILSWFDKVIDDQTEILKNEGKIREEETTTFKIFKSKIFKVDPSMKEEAIKLKGLKNFLEEFSRIDDKEAIEVNMWEYYLIYAQILGIADKVAKQFKKLYPELIENNEYGYTYSDFIFIHAISHTGMTSAIFSKSRAESYSSGGGGFSSGGGGGGSFGGGGGGGGFR